MHCQTSYGTTRWVLEQVEVWGFQRTSVVCKEHELQVCENTECREYFGLRRMKSVGDEEKCMIRNIMICTDTNYLFET
jgi:hypothetical protein